ncbi:DUF5103 domain-containing protein [Flavobacterium sediminis]|uniref:DUF5103 domain-containing protein n=1 Tax=Flavobacterium sediminis TaxID=2201181 RepID=A0A2U8QV91_9FLAO|nr:DUF5103 domain-containing protein [Flavobacterium sediminis]AWM14043.1 DUF5103 domain-containing protein [Flavobacterium sediminis]
MFSKNTFLLFFYLISGFLFAQKETEKAPPFNIKTVCFVKNNAVSVPFFKLGESFELQFDDLYANEADYYYTITQYNYDWTPSNLVKAEYLQGLDNQRIMTYLNSYNTLQSYSHYTQVFPNRYNQITKTGNYILKIFNDEEELVFSRKFVIYEDKTSVIGEVRRARDFEGMNSKQNIEIAIDYGEQILQNPIQNVRICIFQNANWSTMISNIKPQYTLGTQLIYKYNKETQFWGGNEFYTFDTSNIRITNNSVARVTSGDNIYNSILYTAVPRRNNVYTYFPDFNGNFYIKNASAVDDNTIESDYSWVYFSLDQPELFSNEAIYINGMFNNYELDDENKMDFNPKTNRYEKALYLKQGYVNYQYVIADATKKINFADAIDGNFYLTENSYTILVYYRNNTDRYDRVIGIATINSENIRN